MSMQVNVSIKEIYKELCPECKKKVERIVQDKISEDMAKRILEEKE